MVGGLRGVARGSLISGRRSKPICRCQKYLRSASSGTTTAFRLLNEASTVKGMQVRNGNAHLRTGGS
jgi:hypothetical protein